MHDIGIDHIAIHSPDQFLALEDLATARGIDPAKYTVGIGIREMAIPLTSEDVVVLAANAGRKVLEQAGIHPTEIGLLVVGTESAEDKSKPTATHVHELLGIGASCRVYDVVHACIGATYGVLQALDWLAARPGCKALVIASDIARYGRSTLGEPTQGAGAVAMLLTHAPRLMRVKEIGNYSRNVYDFWKPLNSKYPIVDGMFSTQCYVEAAEKCFSGHPLERNAAFAFHTPYPKLVQQGHMRVARMIDKQIDLKAHFEAKVAPSLVLSQRVGNIYTGSLWLALASLLEDCLAKGGDIHDLHSGCYLFSYGSGCGAEALLGAFAESWAWSAALIGASQALDRRRRLSVEEYEALAEAYEAGPLSEAGAEPATGWFRFDGIANDKRRYGRIER